MFKKTIRKNLSRLGFRFGFHTTIQVKNEKEWWISFSFNSAEKYKVTYTLIPLKSTFGNL